jgi:hypothetical protein
VTLHQRGGTPCQAVWSKTSSHVGGADMPPDVATSGCDWGRAGRRGRLECETTALSCAAARDCTRSARRLSRRVSSARSAARADVRRWASAATGTNTAQGIHIAIDTRPGTIPMSHADEPTAPNAASPTRANRRRRVASEGASRASPPRRRASVPRARR